MLFVLPGYNISIAVIFPTRSNLHWGFLHPILLLWDGFESFFPLTHFHSKPVAMLRRRSEFFLFLDDARSAKSEKEEHKEEHHPSPREDNLGVLLQVKMTSDVSEKSGFPQVCSAPRIKRKLNPIKLNLCDLYMLEFSSWHPWVGNLSSYRDSQHEGSNFLLLQWMWNHEAATRDADSTCSWGCTHPQSFLEFFFRWEEV